MRLFHIALQRSYSEISSSSIETLPDSQGHDVIVGQIVHNDDSEFVADPDEVLVDSDNSDDSDFIDDQAQPDYPSEGTVRTSHG